MPLLWCAQNAEGAALTEVSGDRLSCTRTPSALIVLGGCGNAGGALRGDSGLAGMVSPRWDW